jgi:malate synthase
MVKPKLHGPEEVAFTCDLFGRVEQMLGLDRHTLKIGIMDEERRTTANLTECIRAARERVCFINTGFLDRTGDEIHTGMLAGPFLAKAKLKGEAWIRAYEERNVQAGLRCGLSGRAQIGKGMWTMPDELAHMMASKGEQLRAGATTAWVPSPTAAVLHALHYHDIDVYGVHQELEKRSIEDPDDIFILPLIRDRDAMTPEEIERELTNCLQGILGYVSRWVEMGIGCSKVPDLNEIGLMEDRATLRISSQLIGNWLLHGICTEDQVMAIMERMAGLVDRQNRGAPGYVPMTPDTGRSLAFQAARDLVLKARNQPNGYVDPLLHQYRAAAKALAAEQSMRLAANHIPSSQESF